MYDPLSWGDWGPDIMKRRKFIVGVGGVAAGGSALLGSGAFSRVESHRAVTIEVAQDPDAYLGLDSCQDDDGNTTPNSSFTDLDGNGHLEVDMGPSSYGGYGVNSNSFTWFDNVFQITNQGKEQACVWIGGKEGEYPERVTFYLEGDRENSLEGAENGVLLDVGESICVGIHTNTRKDGDEVPTDGDTLLESVTIYADVDAECGLEIPPEEVPPEDVSNTAISFIAFCPEVDVADIEIIGTNDDGEPVGVRWTTDQAVGEVLLKGAGEWYKYTYDLSAMTGTAWMSAEPANAEFELAEPAGGSVSFDDDTDERCPSSPCDDVKGTKIEFEDGEFDIEGSETTNKNCPPGQP